MTLTTDTTRINAFFTQDRRLMFSVYRWVDRAEDV